MDAIFPLVTYFEVLLAATRPSDERIQAAKDCSTWVRDYLKETDEFETVSPHTIPVGSYAQKMSVGTVKDYDMIVRIDGDPDENEPPPKRVLLDLKATLAGLPKNLGWDGYVEFDVNGARRSVHVYNRTKDFHLDVVPCIAPMGLDQPLYVPDRGFGEWILSHPLGYIAKLNEFNNAHSKKVKKVARLLKHFVIENMTYRRPKSYWLGAMLLNLIDAKGFDDTLGLGSLFHWVCDELYKQYDHLLWIHSTATPNIPDPILDHNISHSWSRGDFKAFLTRLDEARKYAEKALKAEKKEDAVKYWRMVFGDQFPLTVAEEAKVAASAFAPGAAVVAAFSSTPRVITPILPTRFHGGRER